MTTLLLRSNNREVWMDGKKLDPRTSQKVINHSPTGFFWGYGGSGPSQLALAILLEFGIDKESALRNYQDFKKEVIANFPQNGVIEIEVDIMKFLYENEPWYQVKSVSPDTAPVLQQDYDHVCSIGWSHRCANSKGTTCECRCRGFNHGKNHK